jgi:hypothetical protein
MFSFQKNWRRGQNRFCLEARGLGGGEGENLECPTLLQNLLSGFTITFKIKVKPLIYSLQELDKGILPNGYEHS